MVKRIEKHELRVGMYIEALEGMWLNSPTSERRFLVSRQRDVEVLKASDVTGIYINTSKGLDRDGRRPNSAASANGREEAAGNVVQLEKQRATAKVLQESVASLESVFLASQSGAELDTEACMAVAGEIANSVKDGPSILLGMTRLKSKDKVTFLHSIAVSALLVHLGREMAFDEATVRCLGLAGLVHDIGKLAIPVEVLQKPSGLTEEERALIMNHTVLGHEILVQQGQLPDLVLDICLNHHERVDGKGYPNRVPGANLSIFARMAAICDVYEATTSVRPYKEPWSSKYAFNWMLQREGHFDHQLLWRFILSFDATDQRETA
ncbi:putative nucleotidyltransferase with HDIG domain [Pararhizobium capsulatum DSM 1112]|uniref:Nucleotidyltransferase with HDIG domain n=1 Tax=Pararhizobium capsulatum DSM 1112 TaxID=1121113 RepID=A0ABU0BWX4_9HYPH|nr:HD-GYP domain-containing protein [Pararhizobium capsulatum]MDQ0322765.1 putative nucleotidyltransferase with HDIG domain [Pararhizobium capsulatum DSM 1112]